MKIIAIAILTCCGVLGVISGAYWLANRQGFENLNSCKNIRHGITYADLKATLGEPVRTWTEANGSNWVTFETPSISAGPIRANVNENRNEVISLYCTEDRPPNW